jgi:hypothetical protein
MTESIVSQESPKVLNNIFKLTEYSGPEDRFTAAWGYVLDRDPVLAQAVADILLKDRGISVKVKRVTDHPLCESPKRPDFCIECEDGVNILVEHKLDALLHDGQLESYLRIKIPHTTYVAFIAPTYQNVPPGVLGDAFYLKPIGEDHFRWSDFHGAVKCRPGSLTQEFADYMDWLGMAPFTLNNAEDIFDLRAKPVQFAEALKVATDQVFARGNPKCWIKGTQSGRGWEVRAPAETLTLIYVWAEQRSSYVKEFSGPVLAVNVYERNVELTNPLEDSTMTTASGLSVRRHHLVKPLKQIGRASCRERV